MNRILLRPAEAAEAVGIGRSKLYQLIAAGEIPIARIGGCVRIPADALRAWAESKLQTTGHDVPGPSSA
jgi:excisionase family DNA binding protein